MSTGQADNERVSGVTIPGYTQNIYPGKIS
jgi:hypothetical protein